MKKIMLVAAVFCVVLLLTGCAEIKNMKLPKFLPGFGAEDEFYPGTLSAVIVNPKESGRVLSDYPLQPVVRINNLGGSESEGQSCISGLDRDVFGFSGCECQSFQIIKNDAGIFEQEDVAFNSHQIRLSDTDRRDFQVSAVTRFEYGTDIKADICLTKDVYDIGKCSVAMKSVSNGPIEITGIEQETIPISEDIVTLIFNINARKAAPGRFIPEESSSAQCEPLPLDKYPKIQARVKGFPLDNPIKCRDVEITEEETTITCEAKDISLIDSQGRSVFDDNYSPEVTFQLKYFFEVTDSSRFSVS